MAQDVRPYKSKEQDGQGNEIILRDQQLVEQTSQTTMASGEYFEIVDVDGRMAKIPTDNMINVVREALGSLLNGLADQTTVTKALTLNGDTLGASTAATLASVLGVNARIKTFNGSNDMVYSLGVCSMYSSQRIIGADYADSRGVIDVTIYGNGNDEIAARGRAGTGDRKIKCYKDSRDNTYLKLPTGMSTNFIVIGALPSNSTLPSDASELTITNYAD